MLPALRPHPLGAPGPWCCSREARRTVHPGLGGGAEMGGGGWGGQSWGQMGKKGKGDRGLGGRSTGAGKAGAGMRTQWAEAAGAVGKGGLEGRRLVGLSVRGIRRSTGRMLGMEILEAVGEEGGDGRG